jgi:hypothetical protein
MTDHEEHDELERLGDELRQQVGGDFRRAAEEDEHDAAKARLRSRTLEHVAYELLSRGDTIALVLGTVRYSGIVTHARGDLMAVTTPGGERLDVNLSGPVTVQVVERSTRGGRARDRFGAESFIARLRELELDETPVTIHLPSGARPVCGVIDVVAADHLLVRALPPDQDRWFVALRGIIAISTR